jgi:hypothetical protein
MRTILVSSAAIVAAVVIAATAAIDTAQAASRFDGSWAVQITTRRGACAGQASRGEAEMRHESDGTYCSVDRRVRQFA